MACVAQGDFLDLFCFFFVFLFGSGSVFYVFLCSCFLCSLFLCLCFSVCVYVFCSVYLSLLTHPPRNTLFEMGGRATKAFYEAS